MTEITDVAPVLERKPTDWTDPAMRSRIAKRYAAERRFKMTGLFAIDQYGG
jgi:hypothetical protein